MSQPNRNHPNPLMGIFIEAMGASSALHMGPEPIRNPEPNAVFTCDTDKWVKHAVEHISALSENVLHVQAELRQVLGLVMKLPRSQETDKIKEILLKML
jgi:hypothetical protein